MIDRFIEALQAAGLILSDQDLAAFSEAQSLLRDEDIADALWLAAQMGGEPSSESLAEGEESRPENRIETRTESVGTLGELPEMPAAPTVPAFMQNTRDSGEDATEVEAPESALPLQVQAAPALPNARLVGRALRPLMRKAPSRTQEVLDEIATVDRIAQEDVWIPVLQPAQERWLDLELVIESSPFRFVWEATLAEFQRVLEQQGAFRNVRTWSVEGVITGQPRLLPQAIAQRGEASTETVASGAIARSPKELIDASGRALVLYVSDCRSRLWQEGTIHDWLQLWSQQGPTTVVQLLPERLWGETGLNVGFKVQVSAFTPGVENPKLRVHNPPVRRGLAAENRLTLPIVTLTAGALQQWANVVAAAGQQRLPARLFDLAWVKAPERMADADWAVIEPETPKARVELFDATASPAARKLARLMSVVPLELPVVHLLQRAFFGEAADPVHVAEVYDSCLVRQKGAAKSGSESEYEFVEGIRDLLNQVNPIDETLQVLDVLSKEIARTLGFEINSFTALLYPREDWGEAEKAKVLPFAKIATQVLHRLGGQYAELASQVEQDSLQRSDWLQSEEPNEVPEPVFPELRMLEFVKAEVIDEAEAAASESEWPPLQMDDFTVATITVEEDEDPRHLLEVFEFKVAILERQRQGLFGRREWVINERREQTRRFVTTYVLPTWLEDEAADTPEKRLELVKLLSSLPPVQFEELVFALQPPSSVVPPSASLIGERSVALLQWAESPVGQGLSALQESLQNILNDAAQNGDLEAHFSLELVPIPGGTFMMGSPEDEPERGSSQGPQHEVSIQPFWMGRYPITQKQWRFVAGLDQVERELDPDPSRFKGELRPVEQVSWYDVVEFCQRLSRFTKREYRLPTEAEWEYACRAGTTTPFHFGETVSPELANYDGNYTYNDGPKGEDREETTPVDHFEVANAFGLSDMHGNVFEWCQDHWHGNYDGAPTDGSAWLTNDERASRVVRGGSWHNSPRNCRSAYRSFYTRVYRLNDLGFRVVSVAPRTQ